MNRRVRQFLLLVAVCSLMGLGVFGFLRYQEIRLLLQSDYSANEANPPTTDADLWARAVAKVKEDRGGSGSAAIEIPTQLRHYEDRHKLSTDYTEIKNIKTGRGSVSTRSQKSFCLSVISFESV